MNEKRDRFRLSKELGKRLASLRGRVGLTQAELAKHAGPDWDQALVSRLETAQHSNPTLSLVADYLRACRAGFSDIADLLDAYTSQPRPADKRAQQAVAKALEDLPAKTATEALKYDIKTTAARQAAKVEPLSPDERVRRVLNLAAAANRRKRVDILVKHLLDEVGPGLSFVQEKFVARFARKTWGALTSTQQTEPSQRVRRLARAHAEGVSEHILPDDRVRLIRDKVVELFRALETTGGLATVPRTTNTRQKQKKAVSAPDPMAAAMIARQANISEGLGPVMAVIQGGGQPRTDFTSLYAWLTTLASAAYDTKPGSPEREQVLADALRTRPDPEEARKLAELALDGLDRQLRRM